MIIYTEINKDFFKIIGRLGNAYDGHVVGFTPDDMKEICIQEDKSFDSMKEDINKVIYCAMYYHRKRKCIEEIASEFDMEEEEIEKDINDEKACFKDYKGFIQEMRDVEHFKNNFKCDKLYVGYEIDTFLEETIKSKDFKLKF